MDKYDLYCEVARERFNSLDELRKEFDRRATNIISVGGVLVGLGFVYLRLKTPDSSHSFLDPENLALACLIAMFLIAAVLCLLTLWPGKWRYPRPEDLCEKLEAFENHDLTKWTADEYSRCAEKNGPRLAKAGWLLRAAVLSLALEAVALTFVFLVTVA